MKPDAKKRQSSSQASANTPLSYIHAFLGIGSSLSTRACELGAFPPSCLGCDSTQLQPWKAGTAYYAAFLKGRDFILLDMRSLAKTWQ